MRPVGVDEIDSDVQEDLEVVVEADIGHFVEIADLKNVHTVEENVAVATLEFPVVAHRDHALPPSSTPETVAVTWMVAQNQEDEHKDQREN